MQGIVLFNGHLGLPCSGYGTRLSEGDPPLALHGEDSSICVIDLSMLSAHSLGIIR
jgi:hypothetical protein